MQQVGNMVTNLRNMALDMNAEVSDQNEQMDRITLKVRLQLKPGNAKVILCLALFALLFNG